MKKQLKVIKVGGGVVEDELAISQLIRRFATLEGPLILVHGGGRSATKIATLLGLQTELIDGRRVTDKAMLQVATMVYGGLVNKNIVALLQASGINALGLTGADGNLINAHRRAVGKIDYGWVGDVDRVNGELLCQLINSGLIPVIAPLTHDGKGSLLNTNADTIAGECAKAMSQFYDVQLIYCFEKEGVLLSPTDETSVIEKMTPTLFQQYVQQGIIQGGMIAKLEQAFDALEGGVQRVLISSHLHLGSNRGTQILAK